jgi:ABC-type nitrate/sulfonate/bicarbonate transport system substrate-binding protein
LFGGGALALVALPARATRAADITARECRVQLNWVCDAEYAGSYIAIDRGYYAARGVAPLLLPGGPTIPVPVKIEGRQALIGVTSPDAVANAIAEGAALKIIAAVYQQSPFAIVSLASRPLRTPSELLGRRIGIQAKDETLWRAFLRINALPAERITRVTVGWDPAPLVAGEVDGWLSYETNEPIALELRGIKTVSLRLQDHGYRTFGQIYACRADSLAAPSTRNLLVGFLAGDIAGWRDAVADPEYGARLAVERFGADLSLNPQHQRLLARKQVELVLTEETRQAGLLTMSPAATDATVAALAAGGVHMSRSAFDHGPLDEVFAAEPSLRAA